METIPVWNQSPTSSLCSLLRRLDKMSNSRKLHYRIDFDWFERQYKWPEVKYQIVYWSFIWKLDMHNSTRNRIFSNQIFLGSFVSKGNKDPGYEGGLKSYEYDRIEQHKIQFFCNISAGENELNSINDSMCKWNFKYDLLPLSSYNHDAITVLLLFKSGFW